MGRKVGGEGVRGSRGEEEDGVKDGTEKQEEKKETGEE